MDDGHNKQQMKGVMERQTKVVRTGNDNDGDDGRWQRRQQQLQTRRMAPCSGVPTRYVLAMPIYRTSPLMTPLTVTETQHPPPRLQAPRPSTVMDDTPPASSPASNCSQGGLQVQGHPTTITTVHPPPWEMAQHPPRKMTHNGTCPHTDEQLLVRWFAGDRLRRGE
jgi:hypothetical protein